MSTVEPLSLRLEYARRRVLRFFSGPRRPPTREATILRSPDSLGATWDGVKEDVGATLLRLQRFGRERLTGNKVWLPSFLLLGTADVASLSTSTSVAMRGLEIAGAGAGIGLIAASSYELGRAVTIEQKLDAGSDLLWGAQGLLYLSQSAAVDSLAVTLGLFGSLAQTAAGVRRIRDGVVVADGRRVTLGALDVGGGLLWLAWDLIGWQTPLFVSSYVVLMLGREAYANQEAVRRFSSQLEAKLRRAADALNDLVTDALTAGREPVGRSTVSIAPSLRLLEAHS